MLQFGVLGYACLQGPLFLLELRSESASEDKQNVYELGL